MDNSKDKAASNKFRLSALELEAGLFDAIYDNNTALAQRYFSHMQKHLMGSRKSTKRKTYQRILNRCRLLAIHYGRDEILLKIARMPSKGGISVSRGKSKNKVVLQSKLFRAIRKNNIREIERTLKQMPKTSEKEMLSKGLGLACYFGHKNLIVKFLEKGADINYDNGDALHWIAREGRLDIIKNLVENHGVDITSNGNASLVAAIAGSGNSNNIDTAKYLIDLGADIHANNNQALVTAIDIGSDDIVKLLLDEGADMDIAFSKVKRDIENNMELPELAGKFDKWWQYYQEIYLDLFNQRFCDDYDVEDLRKVIDTDRGLTGFAIAIKAGKMEDVLQKLNEKNETLNVSDIKNMMGGKISGVELFNNRGKLSELFNASMWSHSPNSIKELWHDLSEGDRNKVNLKQLFSQAKSINLRHYVRDNRRKNTGPRK